MCKTAEPPGVTLFPVAIASAWNVQGRRAIDEARRQLGVDLPATPNAATGTGDATALWLGPESVETTHVYLHADLNLKEQALAKTSALGLKPGRFRADDDLVAFLEAL